MAFALSLEGNEVVSSGTVICTDGQTVSLSEVGHDYVIEIVFETDSEDKAQSIVLGHRADNANGLRATLKNFANPLGTATLNPLIVGLDNDDGTVLYLALAAHSIGIQEPITKVLHYTLMKRPQQK